VTTAVPIAPKATRAVWATRTTTAARTGSNPRATSMTTLIATGAPKPTGVPKPASASSSAPKQKAMTSAWLRGSSESRPKVAEQDQDDQEGHGCHAGGQTQ
jgi:hypothetical protein